MTSIQSADCRVLVVDDDEAVARSLARVVRAHARVEVAHSAAAALAKFAEKPFDAVVSDHDGRWLLEDVRRRSPAMRRILVSALIIATARRSDPSSGDPWHAALGKPVDTAPLLGALGVHSAKSSVPPAR